MKKLFVVGAVLLGMLSMSAPATAFAPLGDACRANNNQSAACGTTNQDPITGNNGVLAKATQLIAVIAGVAALIMLVVSGLFYVTSDGDPSKISSAKSTLIGAIIGLAIVAVAQGLITFVIRGV